MDINYIKRAALNNELKFYHSSSDEHQNILKQIEDLDRKIHSRQYNPRILSKAEKLAILSTPPVQQN